MGATAAGQYVVIMLTPTLIIGSALTVPRVMRVLQRRSRHRRGDAEMAPTSPPIEQLAADLRRLLLRHEALRHSTEVAMRGRHMQAIEAAIGDCAIDAATALGLRTPEQVCRRELSTPDLRRLLRELAAAGLVLVSAPGLFLADGRY